MNIRELMNRLNAIEHLDEGFNYKTIQQQLGGITDVEQRHQAVAQLAVQNGLPGLYDPVDGKYVSNQNSVSNTADKDTDYLLASKGLIPPNANTSTTMGRIFGTSGDKYDTGLRGQSDQFVTGQEREEFKQQKLSDLQDMMKQLMALKKIPSTPSASAAPAASTTSAAPTASASSTNTDAPAAATNAPATSGQGSTPSRPAPRSVTQNSNGTFTLTKKDGTKFNISADGKVVNEVKDLNIANSLMESFGYTNEDAVNNTLAGAQIGGGVAQAGLAKMGMKGASKVAGKFVPVAGTLLSAKDAYDRWQAGDRTGAVISTLAGIGWLVPGPAGWALGGALDAANFGRDLAKDNKGQGPTPTTPVAAKGDPKIIALQKYLKSQGADLGATGPAHDGIDGIMGKRTRAAMDKVGLQESQKMAIWRILTDSYESDAQINEGKLESFFNLFKIGKGSGKEAAELAKEIPVGSIVKDADGSAWKWMGGRWEKEVKPGSGTFNMNAGVATPGKGKTNAVAQELEAAWKAEAEAAKKSGTLGAWIKANPKKAAALGIAAAVTGGGVAGYASVDDHGQGPTPGPGPHPGPHPGPGPTPAPEEPKLVCSPEQKALIDKIKGVMGELGDISKTDRSVSGLIQAYQEKVDALGCDAEGGQGATPSSNNTIGSLSSHYNQFLNPTR